MRGYPYLRFLLAGLAAVCILTHGKTTDDQKDSAQRQTELWRAIKKNLTGENAADWFEHNLRYTLVPGGTYGLQRFRARVVSSEPEFAPDEVMVTINGEANPEAELLLRARWKKSVPADTEITFAGVPQSFKSEPFLLTFDVTNFEVVSRKESKISR